MASLACMRMDVITMPRGSVFAASIRHLFYFRNRRRPAGPSRRRRPGRLSRRRSWSASRSVRTPSSGASPPPAASCSRWAVLDWMSTSCAVAYGFCMISV